MVPILHLSIPVRDLAEARRFYSEVLGCEVARTRDDFCDVWFYGLQLTLQDRPDEVAEVRPGVRHFGVTLDRPSFDVAVARVESHHVDWLVPVRTDNAGEAVEQTKAKLADPSGNVIELKSYADVTRALEHATVAIGPAGAHPHR